MSNFQKNKFRQRLNHSLPLVLLLTSSTLAADSSLQQYASQPRWGQASLLLPDNSLLIYGGKVLGTGGYTYSSSPNTDDVISLSLNSTYSSSSPPWQYVSGSKLGSKPAQLISYATLGLLAEPTVSNPGLVLSFGGDASSLSNLGSTDSSWILNLPASGTSNSDPPVINIDPVPSTWANQPPRRIRHTLSSASSPDSLRLWVLGGQKSDGSEIALNEIWQYAAPNNSPLQGSWSQCSSAPMASYDHASVSVLDSSSNQVTIYSFGGIGSDQQALSMSSLYRFTPTLGSDTCQGRWETLALSTTSVPSPRRGHSAVSLSPTQILLYGGASANGQLVYDDLWLLDLTKMGWSKLDSGGSNGPGPRWGHTMIRAGNNVIVAFGFGVLGDSHAAPSSIGVYNLQDLKWSSTYSPSSFKSDRHSSAAPQASDTTKLQVQGNANWQVPGSDDHVQPLPVPPNPELPNHQSPSLSAIIGAILGILGAVVIGAAAIVARKYRRKAKNEREVVATAYKQKAYGPDFGDGNAGNDDDKIRLINQQDSLHACRTIPRTNGNEYSTSGPLKALVGVGVGVRALWSNKTREKRKQRFDMLADEESEVWVYTETASMTDMDDNPSEKVFDRNKALKKYVDGITERVRLPPPPPCPMSEVKRNPPCLTTTRGGMRIWNGLDDPADSCNRFGTSTSFLGASLAPWSDDGRGTPSISDYGMYENVGDPSYNRQSGRASGSFSSADQRGSWETSSRHDPFVDPYYYHTREGTGYSTIDNCDSPDENNVNYMATDPFDEVETVGQPKPLSPSLSNTSLISAAVNPLLNSFSPTKTLERQGTWWNRLRHGSDRHAFDLAPGAVYPIRDPTPAPPIPPIHQSHDHDGTTQAVKLEGNQLDYSTDEHGRCRKGSKQPTDEEEVVAPNNLTSTSHSSHHTNSTATSSMIEAATSHMVVVQRFRSTESSQISYSSCNDPHRSASLLYSPPGSFATTIEEPGPETPVLSKNNSESTPLSPRPMGPRTLSPVIPHRATMLNIAPTEDQTVIKRPPAVRRQTAGSVGVRAMVKQFETPSLPNSENQDSPRHSTSRKLKIERSLVKKPLLYVANPDK